MKIENSFLLMKWSFTSDRKISKAHTRVKISLAIMLALLWNHQKARFNSLNNEIFRCWVNELYWNGKNSLSDFKLNVFAHNHDQSRTYMCFDVRKYLTMSMKNSSRGRNAFACILIYDLFVLLIADTNLHGEALLFIIIS